MIDDSQLAEQLAARDVLSDAELKRALDLAGERGQSLYHTLLSEEAVDERKLVKLAARILNLSPVWLGDRTPKASVTDRLPGSLAHRNRVLPLKLEKTGDGRRLVLAMVDPLDVLAMDEVAGQAGVDVRPVVAGPNDLGSALERVYGPSPDHIEEADEASSVEPIELTEEVDEGDDTAQAEQVDELGEAGIVEMESGKSQLGGDSWAIFFDKAQEVDHPEDSSVISRDMKDRAVSRVLEAVDPDAAEDEEDKETTSDESLKSLDEPLSQSQITGGIDPELNGWQVDAALDGAERDDPDYAKIGELFVYEPEKAVAQQAGMSEAGSPGVDEDSEEPSSPAGSDNAPSLDEASGDDGIFDADESFAAESSDMEESAGAEASSGVDESSSVEESSGVEVASDADDLSDAKADGDGDSSTKVDEPPSVEESSVGEVARDDSDAPDANPWPESASTSVSNPWFSDEESSPEELTDDEEAEDDEDEAEVDPVEAGRTAFGLGPAAVAAPHSDASETPEPTDDERDTKQQRAIPADRARRLAQLEEDHRRFIERLDKHLEIDASAEKLETCSPHELLYAALTVLVDAEVIHPRDIVEYLPTRGDDD